MKDLETHKLTLPDCVDLGLLTLRMHQSKWNSNLPEERLTNLQTEFHRQRTHDPAVQRCAGFLDNPQAALNLRWVSLGSRKLSRPPTLSFI